MSIYFICKKSMSDLIGTDKFLNLTSIIEKTENATLNVVDELPQKMNVLDVLVLSLEEALSRHDLQEQMVIVVYENSVDKDNINKVKLKYHVNLLGMIDVSEDLSSYKNVVKEIVNNLSLKDKDASISENMLMSLYQKSLSELERLKKIHVNVVPMREEKFKNISLYSKFAAGISRGGEFFDIVANKNSVTVFLGAFTSYLGTSIIVKNLDTLRNKTQIVKEDIINFLEDFADECREVSLIDRDNYKTLQMDIIHINFGDLTCEFFHFGDAGVYINNEQFISANNLSLNENNFEECYSKIKLRRNDRLFYFSPGAVSNYKQYDKNIHYFLEKFDKVGTKELVNECMFQIKSESSDSFLNDDASLIFMEVGKNAIVQV